MMTLKQLEALFWIAQLGTFERAAKRLGTTQSTVSKRVLELETIIGAPIFDRSQRNARLTDKGEQLLMIAEEMIALKQRAMQLEAGESAPVARLRLGITELTALTWLPRLITSLRANFPKLSIETEVDQSKNLHDHLQEDKLDLIIVPNAFSDRDCTTLHLADIRNVWMGSPKLVHTRRTLSIGELSDHTILIQGNRSGTGLWVSRWLSSETPAVPRQLTSDSLIALLGMAVAGLGVTYLPLQCFEPLLAEGKLVIIPTKPELPPIPYIAMYRNDRQTAFVVEVAEIARNVCDYSTQLQR